MAFTSQEAVPTEVGDGASPSAARRVATAVYAAQGAAVAAVFTTIPAVQQRLGLSSLLTTVLMVGVSLAAGVGSFTGLATIRRLGPVAVMRGALLAAATALLLIGWAADQASAIAAYLLFGVTLGAIDVSMNTRRPHVQPPGSSPCRPPRPIGPGSSSPFGRWKRAPSPVPLEYSIGSLTCAFASRLDVVMVRLAGAAQDRYHGA